MRKPRLIRLYSSAQDAITKAEGQNSNSSLTPKPLLSTSMPSFPKVILNVMNSCFQRLGNHLHLPLLTNKPKVLPKAASCRSWLWGTGQGELVGGLRLQRTFYCKLTEGHHCSGMILLGIPLSSLFHSEMASMEKTMRINMVDTY